MRGFSRETREEQQRNIEQLMNGNDNVDDVLLAVENVPLTVTLRFFQFLRDQDFRSNLLSLDISLPIAPESMDLHRILADALFNTNIKSIDKLCVRVYPSVRLCPTEPDDNANILEGLERSNMAVKHLELDIPCHSERCIRHLSGYLSKTKSSLKHLCINSIQCTSQTDVIALGNCFRQLNLSILKLPGCPICSDPTYTLQQQCIVSDMNSLEDFQIYRYIADNTLLTDNVCLYQLPKLTKLTSFGFCAPNRGIRSGLAKIANFSFKIGNAIQSHPSIDSLRIMWDTAPLSAFQGVIPALENCKHLELALWFTASEHPAFDGANKDHLRLAEQDLLFSIFSSPFCSNLETLHLNATDLLNGQDELRRLATSLGSSCPRLKTLTLRNYCRQWEARGVNTIPFPRATELEAIVSIAQLCPSLQFLYFPNTKFSINDCLELSKELLKHRLHFDEMLGGAIPVVLWPSILAKSCKREVEEHGHIDKQTSLELLYELLKEKSDVMIN